jgi:hypothetical protein
VLTLSRENVVDQKAPERALGAGLDERYVLLVHLIAFDMGMALLRGPNPRESSSS